MSSLHRRGVSIKLGEVFFPVGGYYIDRTRSVKVIVKRTEAVKKLAITIRCRSFAGGKPVFSADSGLPSARE